VIEYRGIRLDDSVKLYNKNPKRSGVFNQVIKDSLDRLINTLTENDHVLKSEYKGNGDKILIDFKCGHEPHWLVVYAYYKGVRCPICSGVMPEQARKSFYECIEKRNHEALTEYVKADEKVLIDFKCEHNPHWMTPRDYKSNKGCPKCAIEKNSKAKKLKSEKAFRELAEKRNHVIVSDFKGLKHSVQIDFKCGHEPQWINSNVYYHRNGGCIRCSGTSFEQAKEDFFAAIENNGHEVLSDYINAKEKIRIDFKCGHEPNWTIPHTYKKGHGCPECHHERNSIRQSEKSRRDFPLLVESRGHVLLSPFRKNGFDKVLIDFKCGHEPRLVSPAHYKRVIKEDYNGCYVCAREKESQKKVQKAKEEFIEMVKANEHVFLSEPYGKDQYDKVLIDFKCGHEPHWTSPVSYKSGSRCPKCAHDYLNNVKIKQGENRLIEMIKKNNDVLLTDYIGANDKVLIDFKCKHEPHWVTPDSYKQGSGCPKCAQSKGERIICDWLRDNNIEHETRYILPKRRWLYDIYIPSHNMIIEVQGLQHYEEVEFFNMRTLKEEQTNDKKKRKYAESLGYNYMVVDYREHKPKKALERFINQFEYQQLILF